jgi:surface polysaccharide O-acyltransferase-like enzyme
MFNLLSCQQYIGADVKSIASITSLIITIIQVVVPILLVIWGMLDLGKAVTAQKDDEIKKGQQTLIKRAIAAAIVFFVVSIVRILVNVLLRNDSRKASVSDCFECFVNSTNC